MCEAGSLIDPLSLNSPVSSSSSFQGFSKSSTLGTRSGSVIPKVKSSLKTKTLPKLTKPPKTSSVPSSAKVSLTPKPSTSAQKASPSSKGSRTKSSKSKKSDFDPKAFAESMMGMFSEQVSSQFKVMSRDLASSLESSRKFVQSLADRLKTQEESLAGLVKSGPVQQRSYPIPDASKLPAYEDSNPWRLAFNAPFANGKLTIEGCGTRPVEDYEFFPTDLVFPFPGYARLSEDALVREDKVPKETVIFPRDQAQSAWVRILSDWECSNTRLTPHKGRFTMFTVNEDVPTPCTSKVAELTLQAGTEEKPMPQLRETEPTSLLFPTDLECWTGAPETFTVGKLDSECASNLFSEQLPRLPESLIKAEYEARCRLSRSINSVTSVELTSAVYKDEPLFRVLTKSLLASFQSDLFDFIVARRNCRKFVLADATIRHEPNKLIKSSIWGTNLFPEDMVNSVISEASRANQNLRIRWGLPFKRKSSEFSGPQPKGRKRSRRFHPYKAPQTQTIVQTVPVGQIAQPSTSKGHPQYVVLNQPAHHPTGSTTYVSPAFNPTYESQTFQGYRQSKGNRGRGSFRSRSGPRLQSRGRGSRGTRDSKSYNK
ncbi:uncharacterized protein [Macrobrachium rosenbergii]|uniref:uncharacterized protein n=1 Tax=Macrobrachium rosenbergii TaxID=79674 RepID=UPI0034D4DF2B